MNRERIETVYMFSTVIGYLTTGKYLAFVGTNPLPTSIFLVLMFLSAINLVKLIRNAWQQGYEHALEEQEAHV